MMAADDIINVSEADFDYEVLEYSQQIPVVVDFWAEWCGPCRALGPMLEKLAQDGQWTFRLAKVNIDENNSLAVRFGIHSIPAIRAFRDGKIVAEFNGLIPEGRLREFLRSISPSQSDLALEKGQSLLVDGQPAQAEAAFRDALTTAPDNTIAILGLTKSLLRQGEIDESYRLLTNFSASREYGAAEILLPLVRAIREHEDSKMILEENALEVAFQHCLQLVKRGNLEGAMDGLLDILREDKYFKNGKTRQVMVGLLELLGQENPVARSYRSELASVLF